MKSTALPADRIAVEDAPVEVGYAAWKQSKIERAKTQALDRDTMIPAEHVWRDLGFES